MSKHAPHLNGEWAWSQVDAMADDTLSADAQARMREAMAADARLNTAVQCAIRLRRELRGLPRPRAPLGLLRRLLAIPSAQAPPRRHAARSAFAGAFAIALAALVIGIAVRQPAEQSAPDPRVVAIQEFELALHYMRKSAALSNQQLNDAVGHGLREALIASRESVRERKSDTGG
jgi:hypothetical protein